MYCTNSDPLIAVFSALQKSRALLHAKLSIRSYSFPVLSQSLTSPCSLKTHIPYEINQSIKVSSLFMLCFESFTPMQTSLLSMSNFEMTWFFFGFPQILCSVPSQAPRLNEPKQMLPLQYLSVFTSSSRSALSKSSSSKRDES